MNREETVFDGKIGEVVHTRQTDGRVFEQYRRPPGTRLVIVSPDNEILITKEHRAETGGIDLRLPGGKVRDSIADYRELLASGHAVEQAAKEAAIKEALEETGLIVTQPELLTIANAGATVDWDLYYYLVTDYQQSANGQQLETGEQIEVSWMSIEAIKAAINAGQMQEWRSVGVLLGLVFPKLTRNQ